MGIIIKIAMEQKYNGMKRNDNQDGRLKQNYIKIKIMVELRIRIKPKLEMTMK